MTEQPLVSICIANYNYRNYIAETVESALSQTYPAVEVIVVDDGSTDDSLAVLRAFGDRIKVVAAEHAGHGAAMSRAFAESSGSIIVYLDADDLLEPTAVAEIAKAMGPGVSRVLFRFHMIDGAGVRFGVYPGWGAPLPSGDLADTACRWFDVGGVGGNCGYSRAFLEQIMPIPDEFDRGGDGYLLTLAQLYGTIVSLKSIEGSYRSHGSNHSATSGRLSPAFIRWRIDHEIARARVLEDAAAKLARPTAKNLVLRKPEHALLRMILMRVEPDSAIAGDRRLSLFAASIRSSLGHPFLSPKRRIMLCGLSVIALVAPAKLVQRAADTFLGAGGLRKRRSAAGTRGASTT